MALSDRIVGLALLAVAVTVFTYYTAWIFVAPFLPASSWVQEYFPDRYWAIRIPAVLLVTGVSLIGSFIAYVSIQASRAKARKAKSA